MNTDDINAMARTAHARIADADPCTLQQAREICGTVAKEAGHPRYGGELFMVMRVMGYLIEYNDNGDMVAARKRE